MRKSVRILRIGDVIQKTALSRSQIYRLIALKEFPSQIRLGVRAAGWIEKRDRSLATRSNHQDPRYDRSGDGSPVSARVTKFPVRTRALRLEKQRIEPKTQKLYVQKLVRTELEGIDKIKIKSSTYVPRAREKTPTSSIVAYIKSQLRKDLKTAGPQSWRDFALQLWSALHPDPRAKPTRPIANIRRYTRALLARIDMGTFVPPPRSRSCVEIARGWSGAKYQRPGRQKHVAWPKSLERWRAASIQRMVETPMPRKSNLLGRTGRQFRMRNARGRPDAACLHPGFRQERSCKHLRDEAHFS